MVSTLMSMILLEMADAGIITLQGPQSLLRGLRDDDCRRRLQIHFLESS
jgi:hypothetical protein